MPPALVLLIGDACLDIDQIGRFVEQGMVVVFAEGVGAGESVPNGRVRRDTLKPGVTATGGLTVDVSAHRVSWESRSISVTEQELNLLAILTENARAVSFRELAAEVWGIRYAGDSEYIRSAVKRLRRKLAAAGATPRIEAVRGYGFRLVPA